MNFIERLKRRAEQYPEHIAVVDRDGMRSTTYRELLGYAMRVNRFLQDKGIGKEDTVGIYYRKGMEYIATRIGIIMAGAAWVSLEDLMGKERIEYVINDCSCVLVMSDREWQEAMKLPECPDCKEPDPHDLAFYIYTSGSSGTPKGAAQEYGIYERIFEGMGKGFLYEYVYPDGEDGREEPLKFAHVIPESFVGGVFITIGFLSFGCTIHVLSWEMTMEPVRLAVYLNDHDVDSTFMTPTFLKVLQKLDVGGFRVVYTGGEIVSGIEVTGFDIVNIYATSELGYPTCHFRLDGEYGNTPVGYPTQDSEIVLLDEDGKEAEEGELCIYIPYFRGYHNLPEENEKAFTVIRGRRFYKTADYVLLDKQGRYTVLGRMDEMVKINGNRVELKEVESAVKKAFNMDFCAVKAFEGNNGTPFLCVYYKAESELSRENTSDILRSYLPFYMIPQCFRRITEIPLNANGKVDKQRLPKPDINDVSGKYIKPETDLQRIICEAFEEVLGYHGKVGINDDFFDLGGDSVKAMMVIMKCRLNSFLVQHIYEGRTIKKIEEIIKTTEQKNMVLNDTKVPFVRVNASQDYLLRVQSRTPEASVLNLPVRFHFEPEVDLFRLSQAIKKAILLHPSLCSTIEETEEGFLQRFDRAVCPEIILEKMSAEEFELLANGFVKPFHFDDTPMIRCRLVETPESKEGLLDICHAVCDGRSYHKLLDDIRRIYRGEAVAKDEYIAICVEENRLKDSDVFRKVMDYFRLHYNRKGCVTLPTQNHTECLNVDAELLWSFPFTREEVKKLSSRYGMGSNGFYIAATALALAIYCDNWNVAFKWTWNGRSDVKRIDSVGCFIKDLPLTFALEEGVSVAGFLNEVVNQIRDGIAHGSVSYWEEDGMYYGENLLCLIFQGDIYDYGERDEIVRGISKLRSDNMACNNKIDMEILESEKDFGVLIDYNAEIYERSTVESFAELFCQVSSKLLSITDHSVSVKEFSNQLT